ncbi:hypothetical protein GN956_G7316 [Arapaima gigas]
MRRFGENQLLSCEGNPGSTGPEAACSLNQNRPRGCFRVGSQVCCCSNSHSVSSSTVSGLDKARLEVTLKYPRAKELFLNKQALVECIVTGRDADEVKAANFIWTVGGQVKTAKDNEPGRGDQTKRSSFLSVSIQDWEAGKQVQCSVQQKNGVPLREVISARTGSHQNPEVSLFAPVAQSTNEWTQLVCLVKISFSSDIYVAWTQEGKSYEDGITSEPVKTGSIYSVTSFFTISKRDWDSGKKFTCSAAHSFLKSDELPAVKSISKQTEKLNETVLVIDETVEEYETDSLGSTAFTFIVLFLFTFVYSAFLSLHKLKQ